MIPDNVTVFGLPHLIVTAEFSLSIEEYCYWEYNGSLHSKVFYSEEHGCLNWTNNITREFVTCNTIFSNGSERINTSLQIFRLIDFDLVPCIKCSVYNSSLCIASE